MTIILLWALFIRVRVGVSLLDSIIGLVLRSLFLSIIGAGLLRFYVRSFLSYIIILIYRGRVLVIFSYFVSLIRSLARNYAKAGFIRVISFPLFFSIPWGEANFSTANNIFCLLDGNTSWFLIFLSFILLFTLIGVVKLSGWSLGALRGFFCLSVENRSPSDGLLKVKILP